MDIDFPLLLSWAVLITGLIWLLDRLLLKPRRARGADAYLASHPSRKPDQDTVQLMLRRPAVVEYAASFFPVLLLVLVLRSFLFEPYQIPSPSMVPTLEIGDFILVNKYAYGIRLPVIGTEIIEVGLPERGDVMVFVPPHESRYFIKRVIGVPGDRIQYRDDRLHVNDEPVALEYVTQERDRRGRPMRVFEEALGAHRYRIYESQEISAEGGWTVPDGHYFMMGDNRDNSRDSRYWGTVPDSNIVGKAVAIWIHKDPGWSWPTFERNGGIE